LGNRSQEKGTASRYSVRNSLDESRSQRLKAFATLRTEEKTTCRRRDYEQAVSEDFLERERAVVAKRREFFRSQESTVASSYKRGGPKLRSALRSMLIEEKKGEKSPPYLCGGGKKQSD